MTKTENNMSEHVVVDKMSVKMLVNTLKQIDVRGFDSMDRLVGAVMVLEEILSRPPISFDQEDEKFDAEVSTDG